MQREFHSKSYIYLRALGNKIVQLFYQMFKASEQAVI